MPRPEIDIFLEVPKQRQVAETGLFLLENGLADEMNLREVLKDTEIVQSFPSYQQEIIAMIAANRSFSVYQDLLDIDDIKNVLPFYEIEDYGR